MNNVPPSNDDPDEIDDKYRRAARLEQSRPSDAVRRAILEHAARRAAEHAAAHGSESAANDPVLPRRKSARYRSRWPLALFGTLAAAGIAGLLVAPQLPWRLIAPGAPLMSAAPPPSAAPHPSAAAPPSSAPPPMAAPPPVEPFPAATPRPATAPRSDAIAARAERQSEAQTAIQADASSQYRTARPQYADTQSSANGVQSAAMPRAQAGGAVRAMAAPQRASSSALGQASETGDLAKLRSLLAQPVDIDAVDAFGRTALMLATQNAQEAAVEALLARGANPNIADAQGRTPLAVARATGQMGIAAALQRAGAH